MTEEEMTDFVKDLTNDFLENWGDSEGWWNYRVVEVDGFLHLREFYYRSDGTIRMCTQVPSTPIGNDLDDLRGAMELMTKALKAPILRLVDNAFVEVDDAEPTE